MNFACIIKKSSIRYLNTKIINSCSELKFTFLILGALCKSGQKLSDFCV